MLSARSRATPTSASVAKTVASASGDVPKAWTAITRAVGPDLRQLRRRGARRDNEDAGYPGPRPVGGERRARVARRGGDPARPPRLAQPRDRHRGDPILEGAGGMGRFDLEPEVRQAERGRQTLAADQRGPPLAERHGARRV